MKEKRMREKENGKKEILTLITKRNKHMYLQREKHTHPEITKEGLKRQKEKVINITRLQKHRSARKKYFGEQMRKID